MKKLRYAIIGGFSFILIIGGLLVALANLDANRYKAFISKQLSQRLGRTFQIQEDLSLSFYPYLEIDAAAVTVGNPKGFKEQSFAQIDQLKLRIHTLSLIQRQFQMDAIQVNGVRINLIKNKEGKGNWEEWHPVGSESVERKAEPQKGGQDDAEQEHVVLKGKKAPVVATGNDSVKDALTGFEAIAGLLQAGADIKNLNLEYHDLSQGDRYTVSDLDFHLAPFNPGSPMPLTLDGMVVIGPLDLAGPVSVKAAVLPELSNNIILISPLQVNAGLTGTSGQGISDAALSSEVEMDLAKDRLTLSQLMIQGVDTRIKGRVVVDQFTSGTPGINVDIDASGRDITGWLRAANAKQLSDQFRTLPDKSFEVAGQVNASSALNMVKLSGLNIRMLGAKIKGDVQVQQTTAGQPSIKGELAATGPDLPALIQVVAGVAGKGEAIAGVTAELNRVGDKRFDLDTVFDTDIHAGRIDIKTLKLRGLGMEIDSQISAHGIFSLMPKAKGQIRAKGQDLPLILSLADRLMGQKGFSRWVAAAPGKLFLADVEMDLDMGWGRLNIPTFKLKGLGVTMTGKFEAEKIGTKNAALNGEFDLTAKKIGWLLKTANQNKAADLISSVYVKTKIKGGQGKVSLDPFHAKADLTAKRAKQFPGGVELKAPVHMDLAGQSLSAGDVSFNGLGLVLKGNLRAEKIQTHPEFTGQVDLNFKNLRKFMAAMDIPLPPTADPKVLSVLGLKTKISGGPDRLALDNIKARLDDTRMTGRINFTKPSDSKVYPAVDAALALDKINLDRYQLQIPLANKNNTSKKISEKPKQKKAPVTPETAAVAAAQMIPVEFIRALKLKGDCKAGLVILSKAKLRDVKAIISADNGKLSFSPISARLYNGTYTGDVVLDAVPDIPKLAVNSKLIGVNIEPLLKDMAGEAKLKGTGDVSLGLTTQGNTESVMKRNLNGQINFSLKDGAVVGFNLGRFLRQLKSYKEHQNFTASEKEETDFSDLTGSPKVKNGVITLSDLKGKAPGLRLSGKGILADLNREIIDYTALATVVETSKGQAGKELETLAGITIPVKVKGPLKNPEIQPDIGAALTALASKELGKVLTDKLGIKPSDPDKQGGDEDPADALKKSLEKELGNIFKRLTE